MFAISLFSQAASTLEFIIHSYSSSEPGRGTACYECEMTCHHARRRILSHFFHVIGRCRDLLVLLQPASALRCCGLLDLVRACRHRCRRMLAGYFGQWHGAQAGRGCEHLGCQRSSDWPDAGQLESLQVSLGRITVRVARCRAGGQSCEGVAASDDHERHDTHFTRADRRTLARCYPETRATCASLGALYSVRYCYVEDMAAGSVRPGSNAHFRNGAGITSGQGQNA